MMKIIKEKRNKKTVVNKSEITHRGNFKRNSKHKHIAGNYESSLIRCLFDCINLEHKLGDLKIYAMN